MRDNLCFTIEGQNLYLEKTLIEYNMVPVYFICIDENGSRYIAYCVDIESEVYSVTKVSLSHIIGLLKQKYTMRELIKGDNAPGGWLIAANEDVNEDICVSGMINILGDTDLPEAGAFFQVVTQEHKEYLEYLDTI